MALHTTRFKIIFLMAFLILNKNNNAYYVDRAINYNCFTKFRIDQKILLKHQFFSFNAETTVIIQIKMKNTRQLIV